MASLSVPNANVNFQANASELIGNLFDRVALDSKDRVALTYGESDSVNDITYGELLGKINQLAKSLIDNGVKSGDRVGVYFLNHPDFVVAFFAILKVGGVVVPINPLLKTNEIVHILTDSGARFLIAHARLVSQFDQFDSILENLSSAFVFCYSNSDLDLGINESRIEIIESKLLGTSYSDSQSVDNIANASQLAALVYTSGTTGNPKGAILTHSNLISAIKMKRESFIVEQDDCLLAVLPLCHIYGMVVVMLGSLVEGARLSIMESFDAKVALEQIERDRVTILPAVPAMHQFMSMQMDETQFDTSSLKYCVTGGASMDPSLRIKVEKQYKAPVLEGYALTEVCCVATLTPLNGKCKEGSCGPAISGVDLKIFDPEKNALESGPDNIGEVAIGGPHVMQGYYQNDAATESSFHNGFFLTGDLGYLDDDGYLYICGRTKELIIRGGQNIYPKEIEAVILSHDKVHDVAVVGVPDKFMGERVKACVVVQTEATLSEAEVLDHCKENLAPYKVPRLVEFKKTLPRNSTGKVLKRLLVD